ncbi:hypothetical protein [Lacipirellula sp.]|uniref:hypothetical protein n=1 Tax=Lacipirellula sp. TaxID=2691419 RepID=UPI003D0F20F3
MSSFNLPLRRLLACLLLLAASGCTAARNSNCNCGECNGCPPIRMAAAAYHGELADDVICCSRCFGEGCAVCDRMVRPVTCGPECNQCRTCPILPFGIGDKLCEKPVPGPPPATFRPPMPPKFLPVPTQDVLSPARPDAPEPQRGNVDMGWRPQMTVSGHD